MKKPLIFIVIILTCFSSYAQQPTKEEAKKAFLDIMQTLMRKDCKSFFAGFNDSVKFLVGMMPSSRTEVINHLILTRFFLIRIY